MSLGQGLLIAGLVLVAVTQSMSRVGGALATVAWCVAAGVFGAFAFAERDDGLVFLGIQTPKWIFFAALGCVAIYNIALVVRAMRRSKAITPAPPPPPPLT